MSIIYPERFHLAQLPTPIQPLTRLNASHNSDWNNPIWIKRDDLTGCATSGNKVRKLEYTLHEAKQQGADVIITCGGVQSNHARATSVLGAQLGFKVHLLLRGEEEELTHTGNHLLDVLCGAEIDCYSSQHFLSEFETILAGVKSHYEEQGLKPFFIPVGASDATGVWAYIQACEEIKQHCEKEQTYFDHIVCAAGSGGTLAGLTIGAKLHDLHTKAGLNTKVWGINVCDNAAYFEKKALQDIIDWKQKYQMDVDSDDVAIRVIDGYVGSGYAQAEQTVFDTIKQLARQEGVILDPIYTGKAFNGLLQEIARQRFPEGESILFIHTGGIFSLLSNNSQYQAGLTD